jgi:hypothetical protein
MYDLAGTFCMLWVGLSMQLSKTTEPCRHILHWRMRSPIEQCRQSARSDHCHSDDSVSLFAQERRRQIGWGKVSYHCGNDACDSTRPTRPAKAVKKESLILSFDSEAVKSAFCRESTRKTQEGGDEVSVTMAGKSEDAGKETDEARAI